MISRTERIEAGWWDGNGVQRDYYVASDDRGRMFWLYRERFSGDMVSARILRMTHDDR